VGSHRFNVGDTVRIVRSASANLVEDFLDSHSAIRSTQSGETWEVIRLLPPDNNGLQYHVKGRPEGPAQLVRETQLEPVS